VVQRPSSGRLSLSVATFNFVRAKRTTAADAAVPAGDGQGQVPGLAVAGRVMPFLSYSTLLTVAVVPLAAALYVVTSTTWSAVERTVLHQ
jgi:YidC/Oxa1 family membrane protein insertase